METFEEELFATFSKMDRDGNGVLDREELARLASGDETKALLSMKEVKELY